MENRPGGLEAVVESRLVMRMSLERFGLVVGRCVVVIAGDVARAPVCSTPGWPGLAAPPTRPAAAPAVFGVGSRRSTVTGADLRHVL